MLDNKSLDGIIKLNMPFILTDKEKDFKTLHRNLISIIYSN